MSRHCPPACCSNAGFYVMTPRYLCAGLTMGSRCSHAGDVLLANAAAAWRHHAGTARLGHKNALPVVLRSLAELEGMKAALREGRVKVGNDSGMPAQPRLSIVRGLVCLLTSNSCQVRLP